MGKTCAICGKSSGMYPLCKEHFKLKDEGKIQKCETCGAWYLTDEGCQSCKPTKTIAPEVEKIKPAMEELTCLICGNPSNGKHFCLNCYHKFKSKILYLQIKKCKEFIPLDAEYESEFICKDGHLVKSPYEKMIDDWLFIENIRHGYETSLFVDGVRDDIHPDFYIPEYNGKEGIIRNIYIEFWGYGEENIKYRKIKEYKTSIYPELCQRDGITVLYLTQADCKNLDATLKKKLFGLIPGTVNEK